MDVTNLRAKAETLRFLHAGQRILVLCNVWDGASARLVEDAGFPALATTSGGIANSLGHPDRQRITRGEMAAAVARIVHTVSVPVTADMESGYGSSPESAAETVDAALAAGAVGINLEDSENNEKLFDLSLQIERIRAAREAGARAGVPIVINARTDVYLAQIGEPSGRFKHSVRRANAYREAGADCLFIPSVADGAVIAQLVREINGPINILAGPSTPTVSELERMGVRRVSMGSGPMRAAMALVRKIARELLETGAYSSFTNQSLSYAEANRLFESRPVSR